MKLQNVPSKQAVHCYVHVLADYTTGNFFFRKQTLKERVPDLFHFLCAESCLVQVTFIIRPSINGFVGFKIKQIMSPQLAKWEQ